MPDFTDLKAEVFHACDRLQRSRQTISSSSVRGVIGRGSYSTILEHINAWRALHAEMQSETSSEEGGAPSSWMGQANELWKIAFNEGARQSAAKLAELESTISQLTQMASRSSEVRVQELEETVKFLENKIAAQEISHRAELRELFENSQTQIKKMVSTIEGVQHHLLLSNDNEKQAQLSNLRSINALLSKEIAELRGKYNKPSNDTRFSPDTSERISVNISLKEEMLRLVSSMERIHLTDLKDELIHFIEDSTEECDEPMELATTSIAKWVEEGVIFNQDNFISLVR